MRKQVLTVIAVATAVVGQTEGTAEAGTYPMRSCNVPGSAPASAHPWTWVNNARTTTFNECHASRGIGFAVPPGGALALDTTALVHVARPTSGPQSAITMHQATIWLDTRLVSSGSLMLLHALARKDGNDNTFDLSEPRTSDTHRRVWSTPSYPEGIDDFSLHLYCSFSASADCAPGSQVPFEVTGSSITLSENRVPAVRGLGLTDGSAGGRRVAFDAADQESGVAQVGAFAGDRPVGGHDLVAAGKCAFNSWNACPTTSAGDLPLDASQLGDGVHSIHLVAIDAAGNRSAPSPPLSIDVRRGKITDAQSPSPDTLSVRASFAANRKTRTTTSWQSSPSIRGAVTHPSGRPASGVRVRVGARGGHLPSKARRAGFATTDAQGNFSFKIPGRMPSRYVDVEPLSASGAPAARRTLRLTVRPAVTLRVVLRGRRVSYSGRIRSGPIPKKGIRIMMQGRAVGAGWQTFSHRRVLREGRFSGRYLLRVRRPGVRLQFRTRIPSSSGFPYASGYGPTKTVRVR